MSDSVADGYDAVNSAWESSPTFHAIWALHAVEGSVANGCEHLNFAPIAQLDRIVADRQLWCGDRFLDWPAEQVDPASGSRGKLAPSLWASTCLPSVPAWPNVELDYSASTARRSSSVLQRV